MYHHGNENFTSESHDSSTDSLKAKRSVASAEGCLKVWSQCCESVDSKQLWRTEFETQEVISKYKARVHSLLAGTLISEAWSCLSVAIRCRTIEGYTLTPHSLPKRVHLITRISNEAEATLPVDTYVTWSLAVSPWKHQKQPTC